MTPIKLELAQVAAMSDWDKKFGPHSLSIPFVEKGFEVGGKEGIRVWENEGECGWLISIPRLSATIRLFDIQYQEFKDFEFEGQNPQQLEIEFFERFSDGAPRHYWEAPTNTTLHRDHPDYWS